MHALTTNDPTPVDTFRVLNYLLERKAPLHESIAAKHMRIIEDAFEDAYGPETVKMALEKISADNAAERGELSYDDQGNPVV